MGLEYYDYIDLLAARGVPVLSEPADPQEVDRLIEEIKTARGR